MSLFLCPLCGKQTSIRFYHPETFDDDVEVFHNASLGRGKGFEKVLGFTIEEFPVLRKKLVDRCNSILDFLNHQQAPKENIQELNRRLEEERRRRITAEELLEELDIELLIFQLNESLEDKFTDIHSVVKELLSRYHKQILSNQILRLSNQSLESSHLELEEKNMGYRIEINMIQIENTKLRLTLKQSEEEKNNLKTQHNMKITEYSNTLTIERNTRKRLENYIEKLNLDALLRKINENCNRKYTSIHLGLNELIQTINTLKDEREEVLDFINNILPEEYDIFDDLGEAVAALYQYYEDQIEELSDE